MKAKKLIAGFLAAALLLTMAACGGDSGSESSSQASSASSAAETSTVDEESTAETSSMAETEVDPLAPYEETITMDFGADMDVNSAEATALADAGEPYEDNRWIKLMKEKLNIDVNYELVATGDQYSQQLKLMMSSNELPDYFWIGNWSDFQQMADAGILADMTEIYEEYASPLLKSLIETEGDAVYMPVTYNGRMYGLPRTMPSTNGYNHLWIRQDWLDNLDLERPETMEDVLNIARAFKNDDPDGNGQDDTLGMRLDETYMSQKGLFWGFYAYPDFWITKDDGSIDYGTVQPEIKDGLNFIKTMLDEGLVNAEFMTTDRETSQEEIVSGKTGMYYGAHWEHPRVSMDADSEADWVAVSLPTVDGEQITIPLTTGVEGGYVATVNAEHPEALVKMMNLYVETLFGEENSFNEYYSIEGVGAIWNYSPVDLLDPELDLDGYREWKEASDAGDLDSMTGVGKGYYDYVQAGQIEYDLMFGPEDSAFAFVDETYPDHIVWNAYFGAPTATQVERGSSMDELLNTTLASLVTGQLDMDSGFDQMVSDWRALGGDQVIQEITEIVNGNSTAE